MQITIRPVDQADYEQITAIYASEAVIGNTSQIPHRDETFWRDYRAKLGDHAVSLVAVCDERIAGHLTLCMDARPRRRHTAWFGLAVHADMHSRGIGTALMNELIHQADNWLNIMKVELGVFADNKRAIALYERFGFVEEGRLIDDIFKNGRYCDTILMARFHPEHKTSDAGSV